MCNFCDTYQEMQINDPYNLLEAKVQNPLDKTQDTTLMVMLDNDDYMVLFALADGGEGTVMDRIQLRFCPVCGRDLRKTEANKNPTKGGEEQINARSSKSYRR